ncbi:hypothetical protein B2J93_9236 [Marssonina coronariae]|uniref:Uncharacterized protein n=1 Tax=Diplocarpon coronariae TaxID=2795749 RepID=A0A218ZFX8_9HELO|nr:hypothetical protein B2J93_9236 [Marssonina coronariae]
MAILAVSEQEEQAVVTSTLIWWRSTGTVLGVATSSLVLQNALLPNLGRLVSGPDREDSVRAIASLEPLYRDQVVDAYAASLRATFVMAALLSVILVLVLVPLRLSRLGQRKQEHHLDVSW